MGGYLRALAGYLWASPATLLGLALALFAGRGSRHLQAGVLEVSGPRVAKWLALPWYRRHGFAAVTIGHVIFARDRHVAQRYRAHELEHVRQHERWGPLLLPAYLIAGLVAWLKGGDPYFDNAFEKAARAAEAFSSSSSDSKA